MFLRRSCFRLPARGPLSLSRLPFFCNAALSAATVLLLGGVSYRRRIAREHVDRRVHATLAVRNSTRSQAHFDAGQCAEHGRIAEIAEMAGTEDTSSKRARRVSEPQIRAFQNLPPQR